MDTDVKVRVRGCRAQAPRPMPAGQAERLVDVFRAVADPTRVQMLHMLAEASEPVCVCDFTAVFTLSQPTVSHHLARLRDAGLVDARREGVWTYHSLRTDLSSEARAVVGAMAHASPAGRAVRPTAPQVTVATDT